MNRKPLCPLKEKSTAHFFFPLFLSVKRNPKFLLPRKEIGKGGRGKEKFSPSPTQPNMGHPSPPRPSPFSPARVSLVTSGNGTRPPSLLLPPTCFRRKITLPPLLIRKRLSDMVFMQAFPFFPSRFLPSHVRPITSSGESKV